MGCMKDIFRYRSAISRESLRPGPMMPHEPNEDQTKGLCWIKANPATWLFLVFDVKCLCSLPKLKRIDSRATNLPSIQDTPQRWPAAKPRARREAPGPLPVTKTCKVLFGFAFLVHKAFWGVAIGLIKVEIDVLNAWRGHGVFYSSII